MSDNPLGMTLHRITARVVDIARATAWYRDVLGFTVGETGTALDGAMRYAHLHLPGVGISLVQLDLPATAVAPGQAVVPCWVHPVLQVADVPRAFELLKQRGAHVFTRGPAGAGPVSTFLLNDSEGNELEIVGVAPRHR